MQSALLALTMVIAAKAQTYDMMGVRRINPRDLNSIIENNEIKGYYAFYYLDKESKKQALYNLAILDNSLKQTYSIEMKKSNKLRLLESSYNGERFCFSFVDMRSKILEYEVLDKTGKTVGTYSLQISKNEAMLYTQMTASEDDNYAGGLVAVQKKGFLRVGIEKKDGMKVELEMIDNSGKLKWSRGSGFETEGKSYERANFMYADDKRIVVMLTTQGRKMSRKGMETWLLCVDAETGKDVFRVEQSHAQYQLACGGVSYDGGSGSFFGYGQYWDLKDNLLKDDSKGLYLQEIGIDGKVKKESFSTWAGDVNNLLVSKAKKKYEDNLKIFIHKVIRTADGKTFAVGEMYRKAVSGLGVASAILGGGRNGGGVAIMKVIVYDMVVFQYDNNYKIADVHIIEKDPCNVQLPQGLGMVDANMLAYYLKLYGEFDYAYTSSSVDHKQFNCAYVNYDREKGSGSNYVVGNISYTRDQKIVGDKIRLKNNPTRFWVLPAKPGYVVIFEYYRKKKTAIFRMERLNL